MPMAETMGVHGFAFDVRFLVHASYILAAAAFLVREILWLRLLAILANACIAIAVYYAPAGPMWGTFFWNIVFIVINGGHSLYLIYERARMRLSSDERSLKATTFAALSRVLALRLLRRGTWHDYPQGAVLAREGETVTRLRAICGGEAMVSAGHRGEIARIGQGRFIGEIAYLTGAPASATVTATTPLRCIEWDCRLLDKVLDRSSDLRAGLYAAMGADLAAKIAGQNRAYGFAAESASGRPAGQAAPS